MKVLVNTIDMCNTKMYVIVGNNRYLLSECSGYLEQYENRIELPVLNKGRVIKTTDFYKIVCNNHKFTRIVDDEF